MLKTLRDMFIGAIAFGLVGAAFATVGTPPGTGPQLVDGAWLSGVAGGQNFSFQAGITAHAGGGQSTCQNLTSGVYLAEVDTVASGGDSVCLPFAIAGVNLSVRNAGAQSMNIFAQSGTNGATASTDQINGSSNATAYAVLSNNSAECFSAKNGVWSCVKGN